MEVIEELHVLNLLAEVSADTRHDALPDLRSSVTGRRTSGVPFRGSERPRGWERPSGSDRAAAVYDRAPKRPQWSGSPDWQSQTGRVWE